MARERWYADGWELTDGFYRDVEVRDGLLQPAAGSGNAQEQYVTGRHGVLEGLRRTYDAGSFVVAMWLLDTTIQDAKWQEALRAIMPQHRTVHWERLLKDGTMRETWGRVTGQPQQLAALGNQGIRVSFEVFVPRAFWQAEATTTDTAAGGSPLTVPLTSKAGSSAPMADLQFTITGPVTNPRVTVTHDPVIADYFQFDGAVPAGATLLVDAGTWALTGTGMASPTLDLMEWTGYRLLEVPPASPGHTPTVQLTGTGTTGATRLTVAGRAKYLAAS